jgi:hypothetical protein
VQRSSGSPFEYSVVSVLLRTLFPFSQWPALTKWTDLTSLVSACNDAEITVNLTPNGFGDAVTVIGDDIPLIGEPLHSAGARTLFVKPCERRMRLSSFLGQMASGGGDGRKWCRGVNTDYPYYPYSDSVVLHFSAQPSRITPTRMIACDANCPSSWMMSHPAFRWPSMRLGMNPMQSICGLGTIVPYPACTR